MLLHLLGGVTLRYVVLAQHSRSGPAVSGLTTCDIDIAVSIVSVSEEADIHACWVSYLLSCRSRPDVLLH